MPAGIDFNAVAVGPELVLTAAILALVLFDLRGDPKPSRSFGISVAGVVGTLAALVPLIGHPRTTFSGMFVADHFAVLLKVLFCVAALGVLAISRDYLKNQAIPTGEYCFLLLCSLLGMLSIASSRNLIAIFISLEMVSLPAFVLAGIAKHDVRSNEAALKFFLFGILSTAVMLFGMSLIYGITGATDLSEIAARLQPAEPARSLAFLAIFFVVVGFGFKISAFPFQWWVPDTYEGSPVPVAAFLSVASKTAGFVGLLQIMFIAFRPMADLWRPLLAVIAVLTMTFGNLMALQQKHIIRLLAYSSIAQAGYILLPLGVASATRAGVNREAFVASVVYLLIYAFMELGAFSVAMVNGKRAGYFVSDLAGLFTTMPGLALAMTAFVFSLAGVPPFAGWAAKLFVFRAAINGRAPWLAAAMAVNTVVALFYYARIVVEMAFKQPSGEALGFEVDLLNRRVIGIAAVVVLVVGILPDLAGHFARVSTFL